jgi:hypothetical protein
MTRLASPWVQTASGLAFRLTEPRREDVVITDIAASLSKLCRFTGHVRDFYSVAEHSVRVAEVVAEIEPDPLAQCYGLLHDAHEAYLGDFSTPLKSVLGREALARLVGPIDAAIHAAFGLAWPAPEWIAGAVKRADLVMLATERRDLMPAAAPGHPDWDVDLPAPDPALIVPWSWPEARRQFLARFLDLATRAA